MENYKFSYGLKKSKYMVMKIGSQDIEEVKESVREGFIEQTNEYQ